ncbi:6-pyruvoyl tetrahydropterin synthase family protein [Pseudomonadota bacterium]
MAQLFVERLTILDFSYLHPERGLLGESWVLDVELEGSLDHQGMVLDFSLVKSQVKETVDNDFDHRLLVPARYAGTQVHRNDQRCDLSFRTQSGQENHHSAPANATCLLDAEEVTPDTLADAIITQLQPTLPDNVSRIQLRLYSEQRDGTFYQVSHGLKHHAGNCQRIAHGHRSYLEIFRDGKQDTKLETEWAERWHDIYIGTREDLREERQKNGCDYYRFSYTAAQGLFELELPKARCYLIDRDSTVENLAQHIAEALKQEHPQSSFRVRAFEGINKGAIALA